MNEPERPPPATLSQRERATLRWVLLVVGGCLLGATLVLVGIGLVLPNRWNVSTEVLVHAPPRVIHPLVQDWHAWEAWAGSPGDDPTLSYSYSGSDRGVGSIRAFSGRYAGSGKSTFVKSDPARGVAFVSSVRSTEDNAQGSITYVPQGGSTRVIWNDQGTIPSFFGVFLRANVEDELQKYMTRSLQRLKQLAEQRANESTEDHR